MKMRGKYWTVAAERGFLWLLLPTVVAALQLPPEIQADRHLVLAQQQIEEQDYAGTKESLERILALEAPHGLEEFGSVQPRAAGDAGAHQPWVLPGKA